MVGGQETYTNRMNARDEVTVCTQLIQCLLTHTRHHPHGCHHIRRIGDLNAQLREGRSNWSHTERYHVHRSTLHTPTEEFVQFELHHLWFGPVVRETSIAFVFRTDERTLLDTSDFHEQSNWSVRDSRHELQEQTYVPSDDGERAKYEFVRSVSFSLMRVPAKTE